VFENMRGDDNNNGKVAMSWSFIVSVNILIFSRCHLCIKYLRILVKYEIVN